MDLRARLFFSIFICLSLAACSDSDPAESVLPQSGSTCNDAAIESRYIVSYESGAIDIIENKNRNDFKESFVRPNLNKIRHIEYDQKIKFQSSQPQLATLSGIDNWAIPVLDAPSAWSKNFRGQGMKVAVIDTGVSLTHSQLVDRIDYNTGEAGAKSNNGIDDDNNGLIDDYAGYNFYDNSPTVNDRDGHGTHVAGIIAAAHTDSTHRTGYVQGLAPEAKIIPIKFLEDGSGTLSGALKGIDYAISRGANVINASWGGNGCSFALRNKVSQALDSEVLFVAAAGNSGQNLERFPEYPAAFNLPLQITVGAISPSLNMDDYSNYSREYVHIFAPGTAIVSTIPNGYASMTGTSMATPFVAGAAAILLSAAPNKSFTEIRDALMTSSYPSRYYMNASRGRLHLGRAINALGL